MRVARIFAPAGIAIVMAFGGVVSVPQPSAAAGNAPWTQFHYAATHSGYNPLETRLNPANVGRLTVRWQADLNDTVYGTPVPVGDRVFAAGFYGELFALAKSDGRILWRTTVGLTMGSVTPAIWNGFVIVGANDARGGLVAAYDVASGALRWRTRVAGAGDRSVTVYGDSLYVASDTTFYAMSAATGRVRWKTQFSASLDGAIDGPIAVSGGGEYVVGAGLDGYVYALRTSNGSIRWKVKAGGGIHRGGPAIYLGIVFVPEGATGAEGGGVDLCALQVSDGRLLWRSYAGDDIHVGPAAGNGAVYIGSIDEGLAAFDARSGRRLWTAPYEGEVWGDPALANGVVYVGTDQQLVAHDAATGASLFATNIAEGWANMSSPAISGGRVYSGSGEGTVRAFGLP